MDNQNTNITIRNYGKKRSISVCMICDFFFPRLGGVEMHIVQCGNHLIRLGHKVIVITHSYGNRKGVRYMAGLKVYYCPFIPMTDQDILPTLTISYPLWRSIILRERIDLVHVHQATSVLANEALIFASRSNIPTVYTDHSLFQFDDLAGVILNRVLETTLRNVNAVICVSHACRENLILRAALDPNKINVISNAVDTSKFLPNAVVEKNNRINVVVVSRLVYRKGVDLLVGIIPIICNLLPEVDFILGGDGNKLINLQEMVEGNGLQDRVIFLGAVKHQNVASVLRQGHVFLNCSLTESFCIAILEAASCGLLIVSTNVGGVPEVLDPETKMIILCEPTVDALIKGLISAIERQKSENKVDPWDAHRWIERMYSWNRVAVQTVQVYDRIIENKNKNNNGAFFERVRSYQSLGGFTGIVNIVIVLYLELYYRFVEILHPSERVDVAMERIILK